MTEIPIQHGGYGFPDDMMPMPDYWQLPVAPGTDQPGTALDDPVNFAGEHLAMRMSASIKHQVANALPTLKTVRYLEIDAYTIPQAVIDSLPGMPQLKRLGLAPMRASNLEFLNSLPRLEYLSIESAPNVTDLTPLAGCKHLVSLALGTSVDNLDALRPGSLPGLKCLVLGGCGESKPARMPSLEPLGNLRALEYLCLLNCRIADKSLHFARSLPRLRKVHLHSARAWNRDDIDALLESGVSVTRVV